MTICMNCAEHFSEPGEPYCRRCNAAIDRSERESFIGPPTSEEVDSCASRAAEIRARNADLLRQAREIPWVKRANAEADRWLAEHKEAGRAWRAGRPRRMI